MSRKGIPHFETKPLPGDFGLEVRGLGPADVALDGVKAELLSGLKKYQFLLFRGKKRMTEQEQLEFTKAFGETYELDEREKTVVHHVHGNPFDYWHCDAVSYNRAPPQMTILHSLVNPVEVPCYTLLMDNRKLLAKIPAEDLRYLEARTRLSHPALLIGTDPYSSERTVYFNLGKLFAQISTLFDQGNPDAVRKLLPYDDLKYFECVHRFIRSVDQTEEKGTLYRIQWNEGDTCVWNNFTASHRGFSRGPCDENRWMRRTLVSYSAGVREFYERFHIESRYTPHGMKDVREAG
jgi:alpha-ketoglutarate-dependent taurine dioxygenase